ncbi:MAG: T9SS type A sorting domain-containing protein [Bacteroidales bacterium]
MPPGLVKSTIIKDGEAIQLDFDKRLTDSKSQLSYFRVFVNGTRVTLSSLSTFFNSITITLANPVNYKDSVELEFSGGAIRSIDRGILTSIPLLKIVNTLPVSKIVSQSSTAYNGYAKLAVDGNTNGTFFGGSVSHTAENVSNPWWMWDMEQVDSLVSVTLWNRTDCCGERLANFYVFVSKEPFKSANPLTLAADSNVWKYYFAGKAGEKTIIKINACGRYLRIQIKGVGTLSLAEVQVSKKNGICPGIIPDGIGEFARDEGINVYPNPVQSNIFTVKFDDVHNGETCVFRLQDLYGRIVPAGTKLVHSGYEISAREPLVKGVYFLTVIMEKKSFTHKIIVE